jgi:hypothetical protein
MEKIVDLALSSEYNLIVDRDRTLNRNIYCWYLSGCTEYEFDFWPYSGATMTVKNSSGTVVQQFSTTDGSITLQSGGLLKLYKSANDMDKVRSGEYRYDLFLTGSQIEKRAFLRGSITYLQNIAY